MTVPNILRYWVNEVAGHLKKSGYDAEVEKDGVDVVAVKDGKKIAYEIETGKSDEIGNINKCLMKGFDRIYSLVLEKEMIEKLQEKVQLNKVEVVYVKDFLKK